MRVASINLGFLSGGKWHGFPGWIVRVAEPDNPAIHGDVLEADEIVDECRGMPEAPVEIIGSEPLAFGSLANTCNELLLHGHRVRVVTSGAISVSRLPEGVLRRVVWTKPRSNLESSALPTEQVLLELVEDDEMVFIIESRASFEYAKQRIRHHRLTNHVQVEMIPEGAVTAEHLGGWILETGLPIRLGVGGI